MHYVKQISSAQNALVKRIGLLMEKSRERKKTGLFVLEGLRELQLALKGGFKLETVLFQPELITERETSKLLEQCEALELVSVSREVYRKLAYRETTEGLIAVARSKTNTLDTFELDSKNPLILVAEAPEKPGNIGALLRTADAANLDGVIIANPKTDLYNPNIIRSSVGCVFTTNIATGSTDEIIAFLKSKKVSIFCAALSASIKYTDADFSGPSALVVGTESTGLSDEWLRQSHQNVIIPMQGEIDSMNVSVSAAIIIFEAKRQRGF
ncbi:TrmH family RNA methyltransferase [Pseudozobellia thermophila]|uniref:RNA methyltransferase, TrmH family n=1 Tax=Pseudozobellia thermophila TaxID=192903 RepID=A0A1M6J3M7_9FLAO|nr:RNA methyltransferase [Pseudozobellia thermophila]SHJ41161.1 RNA methyltransferase, TrmH family [Pseudozobellia thermophila]